MDTVPILPLIVSPEHKLPLEKFVRHVKDSGYEGELLHPKHHNSLHWMGKPIRSNVDADIGDNFC